MKSVKSLLIGWTRKHWIISTLLVLFAAWHSFWWIFNTPIRNPWPKEEITIKGRFPFDKGYELVFETFADGRASWYRKWCYAGILYLLGLPVAEGGCDYRTFDLKPERVDGQHYQLRLYKDMYSKVCMTGGCGRQASHTSQLSALIHFEYMQAVSVMSVPVSYSSVMIILKS